jgi:hypothetical protein
MKFEAFEDKYAKYKFILPIFLPFSHVKSLIKQTVKGEVGKPGHYLGG